MNKRLMTFIIVLLLLISSAFATDFTENNRAFYNMTEVSGTVTDLSPNEFNLTTQGSPTFSSDATSPYVDLDGTNDVLYTASQIIQQGDLGFTINVWMNKDTQANGVVWSMGDNSTATIVDARTPLTDSTSDDITYYREDSGTLYSVAWTEDYSATGWVLLSIVHTETTVLVYEDGVLLNSATKGTFEIPDYDRLALGDNWYVGAFGARWFDGKMAGVSMYNTSFNATQLVELYDEGRGFNPYAVEPTTDELFPQIIEAEYDLNVTINSNSYQEIFTETFTPLNDTLSYNTWVLQLQAVNKDTVATCKAEINGTAYNTEVNVSILTGEYEVMYLYSDDYNLTANTTYEAKVSCKRDATGGAKVLISEVEGQIALLVNDDGTVIQDLFGDVTANLTSSSFVEIYSSNFTTSNYTNSDFQISLITDGESSYTHDSTGTIEMFIEVDGVAGAISEKYGVAGTINNGGELEMIKNVTANTNVTVKLFARSTTSDGTIHSRFNLIEVFTHPFETAFNNLSNTAISSGTWATIDTLYINNSGHTTHDIAIKAEFNVESLSGSQQAYYRIKSGTDFSQEYVIEIDTVSLTSAIEHHLISNPGNVNTSIELQAYTTTSTANITHGSIMAYLVNEVLATPQFYTVQAFDSADNSTILDFNVTLDTGTIYESNATGFVNIFHVNGLDTYNVSSTNYVTNITIDHDTTTNATVYLVPSPLEDFSLTTPNNTYVNASTFNITWTQAVSPTSKTVTYNGTITYTVNGSSVGTFSTTALFYDLNVTSYNADNYTVSILATENSTGSSFTQSSTMLVDQQNYLYFYNEQAGTPIVSANVTIDFPNNTTDVIYLTDSEGKIQFDSFISNVLQNGTYSITFEDYDGFVTPIEFTPTYATLPVNKSFNITVTNINISVYFRSNFSVFTHSANVVIEGVLNQTVTNGSVYIQNATITNGEYRVTVSSDGYFNEEKTFTFTGQDDLDIDIYMLEINESNSGTVTIRTIDEFARLLDNSQVNLLEYDTTSLSYIEVSECYTDSNGECKFIVETNTKSYKLTASRTIDGRVVTASTGAQIFEDDISGGAVVLFSEETITLTLSSLERYTLNDLQNIWYNITPYADSFNNVTNQSTIDVSFRTIDGTSLTLCVEYYTVSGGVKTSLTGSTFCVTASSAEVTENAFFTLNRSKEYLAEIYIKDGTNKILLDAYRYNSELSLAERLAQNAILPAFILFVWLFIISSGIMMKNASLTGIGITVFAWILWFFFPSVMFASVCVLQTVIGINLVFLGRKKEDFG